MNRMDTALVADMAEYIRAMLGEDYDDQTFLDTLDGETDVMDMIGALILHSQECDAQAKAMKDVAATYSARAARFSHGKDVCRNALGRALDAMNMQKVPHDLGTVSRTKPRAKVNVFNEQEVPSQLRKWSVDAAAVKKQLEAGEDVPGAELVMGDPGLTVRVK